MVIVVEKYLGLITCGRHIAIFTIKYDQQQTCSLKLWHENVSIWAIKTVSHQERKRQLSFTDDNTILANSHRDLSLLHKDFAAGMQHSLIALGAGSL